MNALLLRFALAFCPREFRNEYRDQLADFPRRHTPAALFDILWTGLVLHAENLARDFGFALRTLRKAPLFVVVAILAIGLAVGANVAVATMIDGMLLQPLPFPHADRLVAITGTYRGSTGWGLSYQDAQDYSRATRTINGIALFTTDMATMTQAGRPLQLPGATIDREYFRVLGIRPQIGRFFDSSDAGKGRIVISDAGKGRIVISDDLWRSRFGGDAAALGRTVRLDGQSATIIGVAPPKFANPNGQFLIHTDYWTLLDAASWTYHHSRQYYAFAAFARLRGGITLAAAQADLSRVAAQIARDRAGAQKGRGVQVLTMSDYLRASDRGILFVLYACVVLVFLIAAANVANLMLARAATREHELTVRAALGGSRIRIAMQLAAETAVVALAGSALGVLFGIFALNEFKILLNDVLPAWTYSTVPGMSDLHVDLPVLLYVVLLAAVFTFMVGLLPALARRNSMTASLTAGGARGSGVRSFARNALAVAEVALACSLLVLATVLVHSFLVMSSTSPGFDARNLYNVGISLPDSRYAGNARKAAFTSQALHRLGAIPGVKDVAAAFIPPVLNNDTTAYWKPGHSKSQTPQQISFNAVSPAYFRTLRVPLLAGRGFRPGDTLQSQNVAVVNVRFARQAFGSIRGAVGKQFVMGVSTTTRRYPVRTIVGVVGDVRNSLEDPAPAQAYLPIAQIPWLNAFEIRTDGSNLNVARAANAAIAQIDPQLALQQPVSLQTMLAVSAGDVHASTMMLGTTAIVALILALAGIYAVIAYGVARRTHEFGIRAAVGARPAAILRSVLRDALRTSGLGITIGLGLAVPMCIALASAMPSGSISAFDPLAFALVLVLLVASTLVASMVPAWRAMRVEPSVALRYE